MSLPPTFKPWQPPTATGRSKKHDFVAEFSTGVAGGSDMFDFFDNAQRTQACGNALMMIGLLLLLLGVFGGYIVDLRLPLLLQLLAHLQIIAGPTLIKLGYVMRINARQRMHLAY